jgi:RNA polymerase sigma-70 factor (ECF subfamily)
MSDLLRRIARDRDQKAFTELFQAFGPRVKAMMMRRGVDQATAEELAQETMLTVWRKAHLFAEGKGSVATWVFTIARNLRIDRLRREVVWQELDEETFEQASDELSPEETVSAGEQHRRLSVLVAALPEDQRHILQLSFTEGLSHSEIAERLGLPLGTVKSRMRLAYQKLRGAFEEVQ